MAVQAILNEYLSMAGTDYSTYIKKAVLGVKVDELDTTAMGGTYKSFIGGLKEGDLVVELLDNFTVSTIDGVLWAILGNVVTFEVRIDSSAVSSSNPKYTGSVLIANHQVGGGVGDLAMKSLNYKTSGTVARAIS